MPQITKTCPECGRPLVERTNGKTSESFLGCSGWPECKHTEELPLDIQLRRQGQRSLFDEEEIET
jgi:ssDNA-binding Zn-finger/Zn-ribbon topoisomerase 1